MKKIDLHMHSSISDGELDPPKLLEKIRAAHITVFSLTDHDTVDGYEEIVKGLKGGDPEIITGVEFSCKDKNGKYHILGYGFDLDSDPIKKLANKAHNNRIRKMEIRISSLKEKYGFEFSDAEINGLMSEKNPGKPHLVKLMMKHELAESEDDAVTKYINKAQIPSDCYLSPEEAIKVIIKGGGIPVLAHPTKGDGNQTILGEELIERIERLMGYGLKGIEAIYPDFDRDTIDELIDIAEERKLYITTGSDFHGKETKENNIIGETGLELIGFYPGNLQRFLDDVNKVR